MNKLEEFSEFEKIIFLGACSILSSAPLPATENQLQGPACSSNVEMAVKLARRIWLEARRSLKHD
jgi:hypothetical protein